ncbi:unnamed protein product [Linum tenue]|uniref:Disease resistance R13L4/SHOC-2-like LRR domain-containing protein n=1 Tax=Linum tenue TaxID=586396 RepID=A0AAV0NQ50_9ROSI|nr:unnamed protein product [Linum tenue]
MDCYDGDDHHQLASLPRFVGLALVGNPQLKCLSSNVWNMVSQTLILGDCPSIESLPEISQPVTGLTVLSIKGCRNLKIFPTGINNLKYLQILVFVGTDIESLPSAIVELDQLSHLELGSNKSLEFVPSDIHKLIKLSYLSLADCSRIKYLPELPPNLLTLVCVLQHSGSEIPRWFAYRSPNYASDSCPMLQLTLSDCTTKRLIKGIAFGMVCSSNVGFVDISIACVCTTTPVYWRSPNFGFGGASQSDNVYMWYDKNLLGTTLEGIQDEAKPWYERDAGLTVTFIFFLQPVKKEYAKNVKRIKIKSVGVSLLD